MGVGAQWKASGRSTNSAHRAGRRSCSSRWEKCCLRFLKWTCCSLCVATVSFLFILGVCLLYLPEPFRLDPFLSFSHEDVPVTLLIWTHPFGRYRELPDCWEQYEIGGCTLTDDALTYLEADAVIFHHREIATGDAFLPLEPRPPAQKWIWMNYESPTHTTGLWRFEHIFNLTMSYRADSDIFLPYGYLVPRAHTTSGLQNRFARPLRGLSHPNRHRHRLVTWVISNWSESHARVALYYQLRQYIQIDVYGRAGRPVPSGTSVVRLIGRYMFYLALENSQHTDYITEKLWNAVKAGAVPVVLGPSRQNYERFLPPEAFIHVDDFSTVKELARYLLTLGRSPARMRRHLDWRGSYSLHQPAFWGEHYCTACRAVKSARGRTDVVKGLARWFRS
ncbi:alpha-(1,3)-fucosyltransferase 4-like [Mugil cephalus]|uniref:alpha-(1,3)-fucosyltransferase 4-like n=1 Tax=Mugil cephalus TaxID=48193 RepID=UPI001FB8184F|nr:alpha-(1,3)-fucosyltransferase 4-like [Mugil cephalus]